MSKKTPTTVAYGDGIGPKMMGACLHINEGAGAELDIETIEIGEKVYLRGNSAGIDQVAGFYAGTTAAGYDVVKTESLRTFDGKPGFTLAQEQ